MVVENIGKPYGENWTSTYDSQLTQNATQKWIFLNVKYKIIKKYRKTHKRKSPWLWVGTKNKKYKELINGFQN